MVLHVGDELIIRLAAEHDAVSLAGEEVATLDALLSVRAAEEESEDEEPPAGADDETLPAEDGANHGQCVSYWAHEAKAQGLLRHWKGGFVSLVARDPAAVLAKGEEPGETCDFQDELDAALAEQEEADGDDDAGPAKVEGGPTPGKGPKHDRDTDD